MLGKKTNKVNVLDSFRLGLKDRKIKSHVFPVKAVLKQLDKKTVREAIDYFKKEAEKEEVYLTFNLLKKDTKLQIDYSKK